MDDQEQRDDALAKLKQFRADASGENDPIAGQIAREMEEQRRSKARNKLIGAGKGLIMASRMAKVTSVSGASADEAPSESESRSSTPSKQQGAAVDHGLHLELDEVFKLMDYLEKEGLQVLSSDIESKAIAKLKEKDDKPVARVDSEAGVLSRVRSNDALLCPPKLDLSKSRLANDSRLYEALRDNTVLVSLEVRRCCLGLDNKSGSAADLLWQALRHNTTLTSLDLSYNEIGDCGAVAIARLFEEHDEMQSRLELWNEAKSKKIELSNALQEHSQQLTSIQHQFRDALKTSMKIQEASHHAMFQRFRDMDHGISSGPSHAEELVATLQGLLLDEDSDDHKLLLQYLKATSKNPALESAAKKSSHTPMIVVESSDLKKLTEICRVLAVDLNYMQDQEDYLYQRVQDLETNTAITSLKIRSNDINVVGSQALTNMLLKNWSLLLFDCAGNIFHPSMANDLKFLTDSPSNLTHLDISGVGLGIGAAELAAHLLCHPVPPLRFLNIGGNSIGDDGAAMVGAGLVEAAGLGLLMLRFFGLDNNSISIKGMNSVVSALKDDAVLGSPLCYVDAQKNFCIASDLVTMYSKFPAHTKWVCAILDSTSGGLSIMRNVPDAQLSVEERFELVDDGIDGGVAFSHDQSRPMTSQSLRTPRLRTPARNSALKSSSMKKNSGKQDKSRSVRFEDEDVGVIAAERVERATAANKASVNLSATLTVQALVGSTTSYEDAVAERPSSRSKKMSQKPAEASAEVHLVHYGSRVKTPPMVMSIETEPSDTEKPLSTKQRLEIAAKVFETMDQEMVSVLSDQWKGLARASVEQDDPVIPISQVDWSSMTSVVYDPLHAHPSISRRDRIRIFLSHLMSMDGRVFFQLFIRQRNVCLSPIQQRIIQTAYVSLGLRRSLRVRGISDADFKVVSINTSKRLKELCGLVFDSVAPHSNLASLGIEIPSSDQEKIDQALAWLFAGCA